MLYVDTDVIPEKEEWWDPGWLRDTLENIKN